MKDNEVIIDGDFEEVAEFREKNEEYVNKLFHGSISMEGEPAAEEELPTRNVIKMSDLSEEEIKLIEESTMDEKHDHLNEELEEPPKKMTQREIFNAIKADHRAGAITTKDKARLLKNMGVEKTDTNKKKITKSSKTKKRKNQKTSRRNNRK